MTEPPAPAAPTFTHDQGMPGLVHAWGEQGHPKTGPRYSDPAGNPPAVYSRGRLFQHTCGRVEELFPEDFDDPDGLGCDACESAPFRGGWQPLFRLAGSYETRAAG